MTKIALTAAAILIGMGTAFAGSDNYGTTNADQPAVSIDHSVTASIPKSIASVQASQGADRNL
jgi:hypothetical protein